MAFKIINFAKLDPPCRASEDQINTSAYLLSLDISLVEAGGGFINVTGDAANIELFIHAIQFPAVYYRLDQDGDIGETI